MSILCQYTMDFLVKKDGTLSKKHKKIDNGPVGSTIACCENSENCGTYWEENDFDLENGDKFIDMKYSDEEQKVSSKCIWKAAPEASQAAAAPEHLRGDTPMTEKNDLIAWAIDLRERFPHWPYKKPKPGHEGFRLLDGPAPDFHRMTVEEFEALPPHIWMDVKKTLPPLEHPVLTVDAYGNYHTNTEYIDNPEIPFCITYNNGRFWPPIAWSKFDRLK